MQELSDEEPIQPLLVDLNQLRGKGLSPDNTLVEAHVAAEAGVSHGSKKPITKEWTISS